MSNDLSKIAELTKHQAFGLKTVDSDGKVTKILPDKDDMLIDVSKFKREPNTDNSGGEVVDPEHPSVGDDIYSGDVNKGEITKRWNLWNGKSNINEPTQINFDQNLGNDLSSISDGLQLKIILKKTTTLDDVTQNSIDMPINNDESSINEYSTDAYMPISFSKNALMSDRELSVPFKGNGEEGITYVGDTYKGAHFRTASFSTNGDIPHSIGGASSSTFLKSIIGSTSYVYDFSGYDIPASSGSRIGQELVIFKDGDVYDVMPEGSKIALIKNLSPATKYEATFSMAYRNIVTKVVGPKFNITSFTTLPITSNPKKLPDSPSLTKYVWAKTVDYIASDRLSREGCYLTAFNKEGKVVAQSEKDQPFISITGLTPESSYESYTFAYTFTDFQTENVSVNIPSISVIYDINNQSLMIKPKQGNKKINDRLCVTYDPIVYEINSYERQKEKPQLEDNSYLFVGNSTDISLNGIEDNFDNLGDGLIIEFEDPSYIMGGSNMISLSSLNLNKFLKISKDDLYSGINSINLLPLLFNGLTGNYLLQQNVYGMSNNGWYLMSPATSSSDYRFYLVGTYLKLNIDIKKISILSDVYSGRDIEDTGLTAHIGKGTLWSPKILSIKTYKEKHDE